MMNIKISVIVPTLYRIDLLMSCLRNLSEQTFDKNSYEIIVVSDGPDERTQKEVEALNGNLVYLQLNEKKGPAAARNLGWLKAKGILIAFTDDDCLPSSTWLEDIWNAYQGQEEIAYSGKLVVPLSKKPTDYELNTANLERAEFITANCACTKRALLKVGGFDERFELAWREDSDLHFKFLTHNIPLLKVDALVVHPVRKASWGVSLKDQQKGMYNALLYKKFPKLYKHKINSKAPWNYYAMIVFFLGIMVGLIGRSAALFAFCFLVWLVLVLWFSVRRLSSTRWTLSHVTEMVITSIFIPFYSVYWQFYGALKYRVLFI